MTKQMKKMLIGVAILFGLIIAYKAFQIYMMKKYFASMIHPQTVSAMKVEPQDWQPQLVAAGSVRAIQGVDVTTEVAGMVKQIMFTPGAMVKKGDVLVQLNADSETANLHALQANAELDKLNYERDKKEYAIGAVSKAALDTDAASFKNQTALVAQQAAIVAKKTIQAPFSGRIGICQVNPGQYLNPGNPIANLQSYDPVYVDFNFPQQDIAQLQVGQVVTMTSNLMPGKTFTGKITTINPGIDPNTRNVEVEATIPNPKSELTPGMFGEVKVQAGQPQHYLTLPQTAISFNPYGNVVYIVKPGAGKDKEGKPNLIVEQAFVKTGETRGDQIQILSGVKEGDMVVTSGQMKLKNGTAVAIDNSVVPSDNPAPIVNNN